MVTFKDAIELVMVLPGMVAKETRKQFADIIRRYMAGDETMHAELDANAASSMDRFTSQEKKYYKMSSSESPPEYIPFDEIVPGASARVTVIENVQYLSIRDVLMHFGGCSSKTAHKKWERIPDSRKQEVSTDCRIFRFPGKKGVAPFLGVGLAAFVSKKRCAK